jgi:hypothetical protein
MRRMRFALFVTIALVSLLVLSCNNSYGILDDIQGQTEQDGSDFFKKTAAFSAFKLGDYYFASTSKLYCRSVSGTTWSKVSIGGTNSYFLRSVVTANNVIYALTGEASTDVALYSSATGFSWTKIGSMPSGKIFDTLFSANNILFAASHLYNSSASTKTGTSYYDLYYYDGSSFTAVNGFANLTVSIRGVAYGNGKYYFASEDAIYQATNPANTSGTSLGTPPKTIWQISFAGTAGGTGEHLYIGVTNGNLYRDGFSSKEDVTSTPITQVIEVPTSSSSKIILAGTDTDDASDAAEGYYEGTFGSLSKGNDNSIVAHSSSIYNTTVKNFPVHSFYWDSAAGNLFVCISPGSSSNSYYGLYMSHWNGSSWNGWEAE